MEVNNHKITNISYKGVARMKPANNGDIINNLINELAKRAEREVPDYGDFATVSEKIQNSDLNPVVKEYELSVTSPTDKEHPDKKQRFIRATVYFADGHSAYMGVGCGHKKDILKTLQSQEFSEKLKESYQKLIDSAKDL